MCYHQDQDIILKLTVEAMFCLLKIPIKFYFDQQLFENQESDQDQDHDRDITLKFNIKAAIYLWKIPTEFSLVLISNFLLTVRKVISIRIVIIRLPL